MPPLNSPLFVFIYFLHIFLVYVLLFPFCPLAIIEKNKLNKQSWHQFSKRKATADKTLRKDQFCQTFSHKMPRDQSMTSQRMTSGRICVVSVTGLSQSFPNIHLSWETSMVTSNRRKKPPMIFLKRAKCLGFFDNEGKRANQVSSFDTNMTPQKIAF